MFVFCMITDTNKHPHLVTEQICSLFPCTVYLANIPTVRGVYLKAYQNSHMEAERRGPQVQKWDAAQADSRGNVSDVIGTCPVRISTGTPIIMRFSWCRQSLKINSTIAPYIRPLPLHSSSFPGHHPSIRSHVQS